MPFEPISPVGGFTATPELPRPDDEARPDPTFGETLSSAFRTENTIGSLMASQDLADDHITRDPHFDPWAEIADTPYEPYYEQFARARNPMHFQAIKADIDRENTDRDVISRSGFSGMVAPMAAGVLDWPTLVPGGALVRTAKGGISLLRSSASVAAAGAAGAAVSEAALQGTQQLRTPEESAVVIGGSAILAGALGAGLAKLVSRGELDALAPRVERDFQVPGADQPDVFEPGSLRPSVEAATGASPRSMEVADAIRQAAEEILPPQVRVQVVDTLGAPGDEGLFGIRAFHGTRHDFDRFDMGKLGTGEGAQVYGHGLYFAENEAVGGHYRDALGGVNISVDGKPITQGGKTVGTTGSPVVDRALAMFDGDIQAAIVRTNWAKQAAEDYGLASPEKLKAFDDEIAELRAFKGKVEKGSGGHLYEVDIDVEPRQLLDLDEKVGKQPVAGAIADLLMRLEPRFTREQVENMLRVQYGKHVYDEIAFHLNDEPARASAALREAGIPGLRFFDAGSRGGAGEGSRNVVVFDDGLIKITKKNGEAVSAAERKEAVDQLFSLRGEKQTPIIPATELRTGEPARVKVYRGSTVERDSLSVAPSDPQFQRHGGLWFTDSDLRARGYAEKRPIIHGMPRGVAQKDEARVFSEWANSWRQRRGLAELTPEESVAMTREKALEDVRRPQVHETVLNLRNPLVIDLAKGAEDFPDIGEPSLAKAAGHDAIVYKNSDDGSGVAGDELATNIVVLDDAAISRNQRLGIRKTDTGPIAEGRFDPQKLLITIAADALDPAKTLRHESIHALKQMGLFTPKQWKTLEAAAKKEKWLDSNNIKALYEGVYKDRITDDLLLEEAIAEQFSLWRQGAKQVKGALAEIFRQMQLFLERTRNVLRGRGFQTADDVFEAVRGGYVASRAQPPAASPVAAAAATATGRATSVGASAVQRAEDTLKSAFGAEKAFRFQDPMIRLQTSQSPVARRYVQELAETPLTYDKNALGEPTAPLGSEMGAPGSVETRIKFWHGPLAEAMQAVDNAFLMYRKGRAKRFTGEVPALTLKDTLLGTDALTYRDFKGEIAKALRRNDESQIPEVAGAARIIRQRVLDPLKDEAIAAKLLPEDVSVETAESYLNRLYNKERIIAERDQFKSVVSDWLRGQESINVGVRTRLTDLLRRHDAAQAVIEKADAKVAKAKETGRAIDTEALKADTDAAKADMADLQKAIEEEVARYQGKTAKEAKAALAERDETLALRDASQPRIEGEVAPRRLIGADKPVLAAARRIAAQLDKEPGEIGDLADQIIDRIIGHPDGRLPYDAHLNRTERGGVAMDARGPLAARQFMIPDAAIERWLESDVETLLRAYTRTMAPDVELTKRFGDTNLTTQMKELEEDYAKRSARATTPAQRKKVNAQLDRDKKDLAAIRDRMRGTYNLPSDPNSLMVRAGRVVSSLNYMRMLGGMTLSAIPDVGGVVFAHGLNRVFGDGIIPLFRNWTGARIAMNEVKMAGTALDMVLDSRAMQIADIMDDFGRHTKFERAVSSAARNFGVVSLMAPWNAAMKQFTGLVTMTRMLRAIERAANGKAKPKEIERLAAGGISQANAKKIGEQFAKHGKKGGGVWFANTAEWDEGARSAIEAFRAALVRDVDRTIITPGQDRPLWMSSEIGRLVGQFKSFAISAMQRVVIAGLQQRDMATLSGAAMMTALGGLSGILKAKAAGQPGHTEWSDPKKNAQFLVEAIDRAGLTGWLMDVNSMTEKMTRGAVGLSAITGKPVSRYAQRNIASTLFGPTAGTIQDFARVAGAAASGEWNQSDSRIARRLVPYNNIFYARDMFDRAEAGINDFLGVPKAAGARR